MQVLAFKRTNNCRRPVWLIFHRMQLTICWTAFKKNDVHLLEAWSIFTPIHHLSVPVSVTSSHPLNLGLYLISLPVLCDKIKVKGISPAGKPNFSGISHQSPARCARGRFLWKLIRTAVGGGAGEVGLGVQFLDNSALILYLEVTIRKVRTYFCDWKL